MSDTSSDNDNESIDESSSNIRDGPANANCTLLPEKSRKIYDRVYHDFMRWRSSKNSESYDEEVLLAYFQELSTKFKSSTLWTFYSMLKSTLSVNHDWHISKYSKLLAFLKRKAEGYKGKKSKTFTPDEINRFLKEAHNRDYLLTKIALIFGIVGACSRHDLYNLKFKDVEIYGSTILVKINNTKNKTHRTFTITGGYYDLCKKYMDLRPELCSADSFFIHYKNGKCLPQNTGINSFGNLGKVIASYLELPNPELYTGHCFRRTSATIVVDAVGEVLTMAGHGRRRPAGVPALLTDTSMESHTQESNQVQDSPGNKHNEIVYINVPSTTETQLNTNHLIENNVQASNQIPSSFTDKSIDYVNINIPSSIMETTTDSIETNEQMWNQVHNSFENKSNDVVNVNTPSTILSEGYTSDSMESKAQVWHQIQNAIINNGNEANPINTTASDGPIENSMKSKDPVNNEIRKSMKNAGNKVVNINIPSTSSNLQQGLSALVRFNNCNIKNVNIYYTK